MTTDNPSQEQSFAATKDDIAAFETCYFIGLGGDSSYTRDALEQKEAAWAVWWNRTTCYRELLAEKDAHYQKALAEKDAKIERLCSRGIQDMQHRIAELEAQSPWIPVSESLPEEYELVVVPGGVATYHGDMWVTHTGIDQGGRILWEVTHWMPLPEPPTGEEG